ncbi:hypothetical protein [Microbacterium sp.]|uniref:hypothetical protein n=1 Tax=Microbacterium sp. TaxID=51671 RepID=UPI003F6F2DB9
MSAAERRRRWVREILFGLAARQPREFGRASITVVPAIGCLVSIVPFVFSRIGLPMRGEMLAEADRQA